MMHLEYVRRRAPLSVIRTRATSIDLPPATTRSADAVASAARTSSTNISNREAVREHDRLGRAVTGSGEQLERAAAVGLEAVATAAGLGHGVVAAVLGRCAKDIRHPETVRGRTGMPSTARSESSRR
jgi:hypothetical protein